MSDFFSSPLAEPHKLDLLSGTSVLPYAGSGTGSSVEIGSMPGGSDHSTDAMLFPGGILVDTSRQLDTAQVRSATTEQFVARMASSVPLSNAETSAGETNIAYIPTSSAGSAVASLPWVNLSDAVGGNTTTDLTTDLPKLQFISDENALLTGASRNESTYNGVPKLDENGVEVTQPSSPSKHPSQFRALAYSQSAAYDHSVYGDASNAGMGSWGTGGAGGMIGGGGLTPVQAADFAVRVWMGNGPEWVQQILGVTLSSKVMDDFADVIHGAVKKHGESPAESIQRQRYKIASSEHGEQVRNAISREFYDRNLTSAEHKALAVQLADGTKTLAQFRKEAAHSDAARHKIADIFRQEHGFNATQQDLDYASMKTGDGWSLQDYRWSEAHSDRVTAKLKDIITAVQDRPVNTGDDVWIHAQQDSLGNGQQSIDQVRQSLARWTADNGGYDATFQAVHNTSMQGSDRDHAADQMGNGRSVQEYRWNEAHSERAWHEYGTLLQNLTGDAPDGDQIRRIQDKIGEGASYQSARTDLVDSSVGSQATDKVFESLGIGKPDERQYGVFKSWFAQGKSLSEIRTMAAQGIEGEQAVNKLYNGTFNSSADPDEMRHYRDRIAKGTEISDILYEMAFSQKSFTNIKNLGHTILARDLGNDEVTQYQKELAGGVYINTLKSLMLSTPTIFTASTGKDILQALHTAQTDLSAVQRTIENWDIIYSSAKKYNIDPAMLASIAIRETGFRNIPETGGGNGRGYFQIDIGENKKVTESQAYDLKFSADFAAKMQANNRYTLAAAFPNLDKAHLDQATAASYNFGTGNISGNPKTIDDGTSGNNYGSNVMMIMKAFLVVLH